MRHFFAHKKYRPGIDDPPPTFIGWLWNATGLKWAVGSALAWLKRHQ